MASSAWREQPVEDRPTALSSGSRWRAGGQVEPDDRRRVDLPPARRAGARGSATGPCVGSELDRPGPDIWARIVRGRVAIVGLRSSRADRVQGPEAAEADRLDCVPVKASFSRGAFATVLDRARAPGGCAGRVRAYHSLGSSSKVDELESSVSLARSTWTGFGLP